MLKIKSLNIATVLLYTALICAPIIAQADNHHHQQNQQHQNGQWHEHGHGGYFGPAYSPYFYPYPYSPYYYPPTRYIYVKDETTVTVVKSTNVMRAQVELIDLGLYKGDVDGILGPKTKAAITAFQRSKDLPQTGVLDDATLATLGVKK